MGSEDQDRIAADSASARAQLLRSGSAIRARLEPRAVARTIEGVARSATLGVADEAKQHPLRAGTIAMLSIGGAASAFLLLRRKPKRPPPLMQAETDAPAAKPGPCAFWLSKLASSALTVGVGYLVGETAGAQNPGDALAQHFIATNKAELRQKAGDLSGFPQMAAGLLVALALVARWTKHHSTQPINAAPAAKP